MEVSEITESLGLDRWPRGHEAAVLTAPIRRIPLMFQVQSRTMSQRKILSLEHGVFREFSSQSVLMGWV